MKKMRKNAPHFWAFFEMMKQKKKHTKQRLQTKCDQIF